VPDVLHQDMAYEAIDGSEPCIALRDGWSERGPVNRCFCLDVRLSALGREGGKALQQVLRCRHREARGAAERDIGLDGVHHQSASGYG